MSSPKSAAVKDIDVDITDILRKKYRYRPISMWHQSSEWLGRLCPK